MIVNNMLWVRKKPPILTFEHAPPGENRFDRFETGLTHPVFLDDWRIKESAGREQSLPPFPIFLRRSKETLLVG